MGEGINIYGIQTRRNQHDVLKNNVQSPTPTQPNAKQQRKEWFRNQTQRQRDIRKLLKPIVGSMTTVHTDEGDFVVEINNNEISHIAYDASKFFSTEDASDLLNIPSLLSSATFVNSMWDKDYDFMTDTFHSDKSRRRRDFERFYYLENYVKGKPVLFQIGRTSERRDVTGGESVRSLDDKGQPIYHYYLHSIRMAKEKSKDTRQ